MSKPYPLSSDTSKTNNGGSAAPVQVKDSSTAAKTTNDTDESTGTAIADPHPCNNRNLSNKQFQAWLLARLQQNHTAMYRDYPHVFESAALAIANWRRRFHGDAALWKRLFDEKKIIKEFVEACPIIDAVQRLVHAAAASGNDCPPFTIVDLACGKGYLSMLLSEMLPPSQVTSFVLMDKAWPCHGTTELSPHHMNWDHIHDAKYKDSWPIPLVPCKQDLKSARERRSLQDYYFDNKNSNKNNVILLAVHLCGTLSLKAVDFFNQNSNISFFCLKPCCLPGMIHAKRHEVFTLTSQKQQPCKCNDEQNNNDNDVVDDDNDGNSNSNNITTALSSPPSNNTNSFQHSFPAKSVCMHGKWKKNKCK
jgi:Methyltransferase domain